MRKRAANWKDLAQKFAMDANENHFSSRRGIWFIEDKGVLCIYNNNPYEGFPDQRDKEVAAFRERLKEAGIKELAYATYPFDGDEYPGYTYAQIIDAGEDRMDWVRVTLLELLQQSLRQMREAEAPPPRNPVSV